MKNKTRILPHEFILLLDKNLSVQLKSSEFDHFCDVFALEFDLENIKRSKSSRNDSFLSELYKKIQICQKFNESVQIETDLKNSKGQLVKYQFEVVSINSTSRGSSQLIAVLGKKTVSYSLSTVKDKQLTLDGYDLILECNYRNEILKFSTTELNINDSIISVGKTKLQDILPSSLCSYIEAQLNLIDKNNYILEEEFLLSVKSQRKTIGIKICKFENEFLIELKDASNQTNKDKELRKFVEELHYNKIISEQYAKELTLVNKKLNESQKQLEALNLNKDKFFSIVAHDLRSPFSSLLGFSEFLAKEAEDLTISEIKDYSSSIHTTGRHLLALLENLLTWSRVQLGRIDLEPELYDISEQILTLSNYYIHVAKQKKITLNTNVPENIEIFADSNMIETVLRNLITNALKFTAENGSISISVQQKSTFCEVKIEDNGVGIPDHVKSKMFKIEAHHTTEGTNNEKGSGLGLIICKEFITKNAGTIEFESTEGKGTTFTIRLPRSKYNKGSSKKKSDNSRTKKTSGYKFSK
jgi:signal transduction histidine kinase